MEAISGYFEDLDFARCALGDHALDGDRLTVSVLSGLVLKEHHPLARSGTPPPGKCRLVFLGLTYAKRILRSKRRDGSLKEDANFLGPFSQGHGPTRAFDFGGAVEAPAGVYKAVHMGPVAVPTRYADQGVGERLIRHGMQRAASLGYELVLAMGPYDHFHRFGFLSARVQGFSSKFQLSDDVFLARRLDEQPLGEKRGKVLYPEHILAAATE